MKEQVFIDTGFWIALFDSRVLRKLNRFEEADRFMEQAYRLNPKNDKTASEYAGLLFRRFGIAGNLGSSFRHSGSLEIILLLLRHQKFSACEISGLLGTGTFRRVSQTN